ncbi:MAG: 50S ribosomal protein L22 [bacterium]|nr:50S ribosomal protein L22 [bacterium]
MAESTESVDKPIEVRARLGDLHMSPRKVRLVIRLIKGKTVTQARQILKFTVKKATHPILKLLNSAAANASHNFQLQPDTMIVKNITANQGRVMRRFMPRAQGRAFPIKKRQSIVDVILVSAIGGKQQVSKSAKSSKTETEKLPKPQTAQQEANEGEQKSEPVKNKYGFSSGSRIHSGKQKAATKRRLFDRKTNA